MRSAFPPIDLRRFARISFSFCAFGLSFSHPMGDAMDRSKPGARDRSKDPDVRLETDLQADTDLREGPVTRGHLILLVIAAIIVVLVVLWVVMGTR